ncbi:MAG TPA: transcriptional regulator [Firmicutes bacterium]|nr:transcriptional regulator [Bacillota bacterium]
MEFVRIGEKLISRGRILRALDRLLELRVQGLSQAEAGQVVGVDRTFVSRLETLGEVGKGPRVALIGFPVGNKQEIEEVARREGVEYVLLWTDAERWAYFGERSGIEIANEIMGLISRLKEYDAVIFAGSDMRIGLAEAILGPKVVGVELGTSPIEGDRPLDPAFLRDLIRRLKDTRRRDH